MNLPTLYKRSSTGAIQQWWIVAGLKMDGTGTITVTHGQVGGKLQEGTDYITEGKNPGKKNATTPFEQACKEAEARWTKQKKKGYVESLEAAQAGELDAVIEGGILPMLAPNKSYPNDDELSKRIVYPCFFQPKLDGMRCIAIIDDGVCTMWSRTRKRINTVPHIVAALEARFRAGVGRVVLDGELYSHNYKDRFEDLLSLLRGNEPDADGEYLNAEFHAYDCPEADVTIATPGGNIWDVKVSMADSFAWRNDALDDLLDEIDSDGPVKRVVTTKAEDLAELHQLFEQAEADGYEGGMARNLNGGYESGKRSKNLQKMKRFIDQEFKITDIEDGRGKDAGTVAKFVCVTDDGKEFRCRLKATYARRRELMQKPEQWQGKQLTVRFKRWTADGVPYIPIGQCIRDYE